MPGTTAIPDIELIVEDVGGGGGGPTPPPGGGDDGDGDDGKRRRKESPTPRRYSTAIALGIVSILMFFMALSSAFIVLRRGSDAWVTVHLPPVLWANTAILLASSFTLEVARRRLSLTDLPGFRKFWMVTTVLGLCLLPDNSLLGASLWRRAFTLPAIRPAVFSIFSLRPTACISSVELARCSTF